MATSRASSTCLRTIASAQTSRQAGATSRFVSRRCLHTPPPLYLDFLAPSWRSQNGNGSSRRSIKQAIAPQQTFTQRAFSTTRPRHAKAITNPRKDDDGNERIITITPRAAHRLQAISEKDNNPDLALRVAVESGGCHGFQYLMSLVNTADMDGEEDTLFENEEVANKKGDGEYRAKVVMDEPSLELLSGSSIDYTMELIGSQFKVTGM